MIIEAARAALFGALPVAVFTFLVVQWGVASRRIGRFTDEKDLRRQYDTRAKENKRARKAARAERSALKLPDLNQRAVGDLLHGKVMFFGGGFYGTMAVLTYILIELREIWQFLTGMLDPDTWINRLGVGLLIEFLVNSITNMVAALVWFSTLPDYIRIGNGWIWLGAAYLGYLAGTWVTREFGDTIWRQLGDISGALVRRLWR